MFAIVNRVHLKKNFFICLDSALHVYTYTSDFINYTIKVFFLQVERKCTYLPLRHFIILNCVFVLIKHRIPQEINYLNNINHTKKVKNNFVFTLHKKKCTYTEKLWEIFEFTKNANKTTYNRTHKIDEQLTMCFASHLQMKFVSIF